MRVTGGKWRGRTLVAPKGGATRPTTDMVRQALFNIVGPEVKGARVLDLCAGTGAVGLEALSRGAAAAVAVEPARAALSALEKNRAALGAGLEIVAQEAARALRTLAARGDRFDLVFIDPPYRIAVDDWLATLPPLLDEDAVVILERSSRDAIPPAPWGEPRVREYGDTALLVWKTR